MFGLTDAEMIGTLAVVAFSGFVKGAIGFAMPMILMSGLGSFLPAETALAILILPTVVLNVAQAFRQGVAPALESTRTYRWHIAMVVLFIVISAQFVHVVPERTLYLALGVLIVGYCGLQLGGVPLALPIHHRRRAEIISGVIGGLYGGLSGIWGPPLIIYLLSIHAPKAETIRVQGVVFLIGAVVLLGAHLTSGVLNATTLPLSALMVLPAGLAMWVGFKVQDRLDLGQFRRWTLVMLVLTGGNLLRKGLGL